MKPIDCFLDRVFTSDCLRLLPSIPTESVHLVVTDPPYLVNYLPRDGRRCAGDNTAYWLQPAFRELYRILKADSFCVSFYGWPWADRFMAAWKEVGFRPVSHLTWIKSHCSREGYTGSFHEVGYLLAKGRPAKPAKPLPDVLPWEYTGNELHPNQKPVVAIRPLVESFSKPSDIVLDPFCGSGTTGVAARMSSRRFILIDKETHHCRTAVRRLAFPVELG